MATKFGEGYIEVETRVDQPNFVRMSEQMAQRGALVFGKEWSKGVKQALADSDKQFDVSMNKHISSYQALAKQREKAEDDLAKKMDAHNKEYLRGVQERTRAEAAHIRELDRMQNEIASKTENDRRISAAYEAEGKRAADAFAREQNKGFDGVLNSYRKGLARLDNDQRSSFVKTLDTHDKDVDRHGHRWGSTVARHLQGGLEAGLSILPARLEGIFTSSGPVIGTALFVAFAGAIAFAAPALGAMFTGLFVASLGLGAVLGAVFVGVADDDRVLGAARRLKTNFMEEFIYYDTLLDFGQIVADELDKVSLALDRWAPDIQAILRNGALYLPIVVDGLIGFGDGFIKPLNNLLNSQFMMDIMKIFGEGLKSIGEAFGVSFDKLMNDPEAQEGAKKGLRDFFDVISGGIKTIMDFCFWLAVMWERLNKDQEGDPNSSKLDEMRENWKKFRDGVNEAVHAIAVSWVFLRETFWTTYHAIVGWLQDTGIMDSLKETFSAGWDAIVAIFNSVKLQVSLILGFMILLWQNWGSKIWNIIKGMVGPIIQFFKGLLDIIKGVFQIITGLLTGDWSKVWEGIKNVISGVMNAVWAIVKYAWQFIKLAFTVGAGIIQTLWSVLWSKIGDFVKETWHSILAFLIGWFNNVQNWFTNVMRFFKDTWNAAWGAVKEFFIGIWNGIFNFLVSIWNRIWGFIGPGVKLLGEIIRAGFQVVVAIILIAMEIISRIWQLAWDGISTVFRVVWGAIWGFLQPIITIIIAVVVGAVLFIRSMWETVWNAISSFFQMVWNAILAFVIPVINAIRNWIHDFLVGVNAIWTTVWGVISGFFEAIWKGMHDTATNFIGQIRDVIAMVMEVIRVAWNSVWQGISDVLGGIWNGIVAAVHTGLQFVIDVLNKGIKAINGVLEKLGIDFRVGEIPPLGGAPTVPQTGANGSGRRESFASGGRVYGPGTTTSDSIHARLSKKEYVINARSAQKMGYQNLDYINRTGRVPGFAAGGRVDSGNNGLLEEHRNHVHVAMDVPPMGYEAIIAAAAASGIPFSVSSTYRPGSRGSGGGLDHHSEGRAVDFGGYEQDALASYFQNLPGVIELIHRSAAGDYAIFGGKGGGVGGFLNQFLGKGLGWVMDNMLNPVVDGIAAELPKNVAGQIGRGVIGGLRDGLRNKIETFIAAQREKASLASKLSGGGGGNVQQWSDTALFALQRLGLPESWLAGLLAKMNQESGGNPMAINNWDSNAAMGIPSKGLMQVIDPTFAAYRDPSLPGDIWDPLANITAALRYIVSRYGGVPNLPAGGYDYGGLWPSGTLGVNTSGGTEMVLNPSQANAFEERIRGEGGDRELNLHIDLGEGITQVFHVKIDRHDRATVRPLNSLRRR